MEAALACAAALLGLSGIAPRAQATLVLDLNRAPLVGRPSNPADFLGTPSGLFFTAETLLEGRELWYAQVGAGTVLVADLVPGNASSNPRDLQPFGTDVAFTAGAAGLRSVYRTVGANQVVRLTSPTGASAVTDPANLIELDNRVLFFAADATNGRGLWSVDGSGTGVPLRLTAAPLQETLAAHFGSRIAFLANDGASGYEMWVSDGTAAGTRMVADLNPGAGDGVARVAPVTFGNELLFAGNDGATGLELFATDGSVVRRVLDLIPGSVSSSPAEFLVVGNRLVFTASTVTSTLRSLFVSDGTANGTKRVAGSSINARQPIALGNGRVLFGQDSGNRLLIHSCDVATAQATDLGVRLGLLQSSDLSVAGARAYLGGGEGLWVTDGSVGGTARIGSNASRIAGRADGTAFFAAAAQGSGEDLWFTDGTDAGTGLFDEVAPGVRTLDAAPYLLTAIGGRALFSAVEANGSIGLYASDGTAPGTVRLATTVSRPRVVAEMNDFVLVYEFGSTTTLVRCDGFVATPIATLKVAEGTALDGHRAVFAASRDGGRTSQLWISDGSVAGTRVLADIRPGGDAAPASFQRVRQFVYFFADDGVHDRELWRTDGTTSGTTLVQDLQPTGTRTGEVLGSVGSLVVFAASDGVHGMEPWVTDGTPNNARLLADIVPGSGSSQVPATRGATLADRFVVFPSTSRFYATDGTTAGTVGLPLRGLSQFVALGGKLLSTVIDSTPFELFVTDGTAAGTTRIALLLATGARSVSISDDRAIVRTYDPSGNGLVLQTDGTAAGTRVLDTTYSLPRSDGLVAVDGRVLFAANDALHGNELWQLDVGATARSVGLGCGSVNDATRLHVTAPVLGAGVEFVLDTALPVSVLVLGNLAARPLRVASLGSGCSLFVAIDGSQLIVPMPVNHRLRVPLPNMNALIGRRMAAQALAGPTARGADLSQGVRLRFGF